MNTPETPVGQPDAKPHIKGRITMADLPVAFPHDQVKPILALGGRLIDPFETLRQTFETYKDYPPSEEHMTRLKPRLSADEQMGLRQTKRGLRMPAERYCRFLLAVAETVPVPSEETILRVLDRVA